jgi:hypothetical protein
MVVRASSSTSLSGEPGLGPRPTRLTLGDQEFLDEVGERSAFFGRLLRQRGVLRGDPAEPELVAQLSNAPP